VILADLQRVAAARPGRPLYADLSVTVATGDRLGVVGLNGCGKSTLLRVIAGTAPPEAGTVRRGRDVRVAFLDQHPELPAGTVRAAAAAPSTAPWEVEAMLDRLGMAAVVDADVSTLSGGQAKRVALARTLLSVEGGEGDLLILDEPTNHLDLDAISWLEDHLAGFRGGMVVVTHDRHVLDRVTTRVLELDRGVGHVHDGGYAGYLEARALREEQAATAESVRRNLARTELAWLRRGAPARTSKPRARIAAATAIVEGRAAAPARSGGLDLAVATGGAGTARLGDKVVELDGVGVPWGRRRPPLLRDVTLSSTPRERLGIVGPNARARTTLLDLIAGRVAPTSGSVERGTTVRLGYYDQHGTRPRPPGSGSATRWPAGAPDLGARQAVRAVLVRQRRPVRTHRPALGRRAPAPPAPRRARRQPNVLLLDEPTNDLDLDTLRVLEDFLEDWKGAPRHRQPRPGVPERTVDAVVALDGSGSVAGCRGGYAQWEGGAPGPSPGAGGSTRGVRGERKPVESASPRGTRGATARRPARRPIAEHAAPPCFAGRSASWRASASPGRRWRAALSAVPGAPPRGARRTAGRDGPPRWTPPEADAEGEVAELRRGVTEGTG
jgi:ATP-binding cassette subfamily F protein uup